MFKKTGLIFVSFFISVSISFASALDKAMDNFHNGNYSNAFEQFLELSQQQIPDAQFYLGGMYLDGLGTKKDPEQAVYWLDQAVKHKHRDAATMLGKMYLSGLGTPMDPMKGMYYLELADKYLPEGEELEECD